MHRALTSSFLALVIAGCVSQTARERTVVQPAAGTVDVDRLFASQVTPEKKQQIEKLILAGGLGHPDAPRHALPAQSVAQQPMPAQQVAYQQTPQSATPAPQWWNAAPTGTAPVPNKPAEPYAHHAPSSNCSWRPPQNVPPPAATQHTFNQAPPPMPAPQASYHTLPPAQPAYSQVQQAPVQQAGYQVPPPAPAPEVERVPLPALEPVNHVASAAPMQQAIYPQDVASSRRQEPIGVPSAPRIEERNEAASSPAPAAQPKPVSRLRAGNADHDEPPPVPRRLQAPSAAPMPTPAPSPMRPGVKLKGTAGKPGTAPLAILDIEGMGVRFLREGQSLDVPGPQGSTTIRIQKISRDAVFVDVGNTSEVLR